MRDIDKPDVLDELEKDAIFGAIGRRAMLKRISATLGPHAAEGLRANPAELKNIHRMLKNIPKGGTTGTVDLAQVAPGFHKSILKGKPLEGEMLNRMVSPSQRSALVRPAEPDTIPGMLGKTMRKNPLGTLIAGGGLGLATKKLLEKSKPSSDRGGGGGRAVVVT